MLRDIGRVGDLAGRQRCPQTLGFRGCRTGNLPQLAQLLGNCGHAGIRLVQTCQGRLDLRGSLRLCCSGSHHVKACAL